MFEETDKNEILASLNKKYAERDDITEGDNMSYVMGCISSAISDARRSFVTDVVEFNHEIMHKVQKEQEVTALFPLAIKNREFVVYYQPKVDLSTNTDKGYIHGSI